MYNVNVVLTPIRAKMVKLAKDQPNVKSVSTRDGKIRVWFTGRDDPIEIPTPDDLYKVGIQSPDWKGLKLDTLISNNA